MEWIPKYLGAGYSLLFSKLGTKPFSLAEAAEILGRETGAAQKILHRLDIAGYLVRSKEELDTRVASYTLIPPEATIFAAGIRFSFAKTPTTFELIKKAAEAGVKYLIVGTSAAQHYHHYLTPAYLEIGVKIEDFNRWYSLLRNKKTLVITRAPLPSEKKYEIIGIHTITDKEFGRKRIIDDLFVASPEDLMVSSIEKGTESSILEALALIIRTKDLNFEKAFELAREKKVSHVLGFLISVLQAEFKKKIVSKKLLQENSPVGVITKKGVEKKPVAVAIYDYPFDTAEKAKRLGKKLKDPLLPKKDREYIEKQLISYAKYKKMGKEWLINSFLPETIVRKVIEDLGAYVGA